MKRAYPGVASSWQTGLATGLTGMTLGVVGFGRLGSAVARIASLAFGMKVVCWSENLTQEKADRKAEEMGLKAYDGNGDPVFRAVRKEELFRSADVISMHYVLSERSRGLVAERELELMKKSALLVNTSRGALVDQNALYEALQKGRITGAALDVFDIEPLPVDSVWRSTDWGFNGKSRLLLTPHMGYVEEGIMHTWYEETAENVERWLDGKEVYHQLT
jgi:phosphoglycerate dehydrogenase-like enzyme